MVACTQTDTPKYTEAQVITILKGHAGCPEVGAKPSWTAEYTGNGKWKVLKECIIEEGSEKKVVSSETWYFDEKLGKAQKGF